MIMQTIFLQRITQKRDSKSLISIVFDDDMINMASMTDFVFERIENIVGKSFTHRVGKKILDCLVKF